MIVDLPPGTGDTQLTLLQSVPVSGAVIVTTPQDVALDDARKGLQMFGRHDTPVLGVVENMSTFHCPDCGSDHDIFGSGGGRDFAEETEMPFLGEIPLDPSVRGGRRRREADGPRRRQRDGRGVPPVRLPHGEQPGYRPPQASLRPHKSRTVTAVHPPGRATARRNSHERANCEKTELTLRPSRPACW